MIRFFLWRWFCNLHSNFQNLIIQWHEENQKLICENCVHFAVCFVPYSFAGKMIELIWNSNFSYFCFWSKRFNAVCLTKDMFQFQILYEKIAYFQIIAMITYGLPSVSMKYSSERLRQERFIHFRVKRALS